MDGLTVDPTDLRDLAKDASRKAKRAADRRDYRSATYHTCDAASLRAEADRIEEEERARLLREELSEEWHRAQMRQAERQARRTG